MIVQFYEDKFDLALRYGHVSEEMADAIEQVFANAKQCPVPENGEGGRLSPFSEHMKK